MEKELNYLSERIAKNKQPMKVVPTKKINGNDVKEALQSIVVDSFEMRAYIDLLLDPVNLTKAATALNNVLNLGGTIWKEDIKEENIIVAKQEEGYLVLKNHPLDKIGIMCELYPTYSFNSIPEACTFIVLQEQPKS